MVEIESEHLNAALAKVEINLASKKVKEAKAVKVKEKLAEMEKKATERAMKASKASTEFSMKKAQSMVAFQMSEELYNDRYQFSK